MAKDASIKQFQIHPIQTLASFQENLKFYPWYINLIQFVSLCNTQFNEISNFILISSKETWINFHFNFVYVLVGRDGVF